MDTLVSYDELPYDSVPLPETQPDSLAAVAHIHGFEAPDPRHARILELGCAQGGNLIPLAWRWPEAECVGVELSRAQAESGVAFIAELGAKNVRILHGDLADLPDSLGEFDYIISHGVYSWVPPSVQQALLEVCRRHLSASGVAYISFNVKAGWEALQPLRATLLERTSTDASAPQRYQQALRVLDELATEWTDPLLLKEIDFLKSAAPSYLFHEYLADFNCAFTFDAFADQLDAHGLRYVGEAGPRHVVVELEDTWGLAPEGMAGRWLDAEMALDDAHAIRFRHALIARADAPCAQPAQGAALRELAFHADLRCDEELDLESDSEQRFFTPAGRTLPVTQPVMKAALMVLSLAYPAALSYPDLRAAAGQLMAEYGIEAQADEAAFQNGLFQLVMAQGVMPSVHSGPVAISPGERPCAHALARVQVQSHGWSISSAHHLAMDLDAPARELLGLLDGTRSLADLAGHMHARLTASGMACTLEAVQEMTNRQVWLFARQGLLIA